MDQRQLVYSSTDWTQISYYSKRIIQKLFLEEELINFVIIIKEEPESPIVDIEVKVASKINYLKIMVIEFPKHFAWVILIVIDWEEPMINSQVERMISLHLD